jgi:predicted dehydrogenase
MAAQVRYRNGALMSYSCTTYSPYEGYRIAFNGTRGRLEAWIKESQPWEEPAHDELRLTTSFGTSELIRVSHHEGGHGGGDDRMRDRLFRAPEAPDPHGQGATLRDGAMAVLVGFAARQSARTGQPVKITDLTDFELYAERPRGETTAI